MFRFALKLILIVTSVQAAFAQVPSVTPSPTPTQSKAAKSASVRPETAFFKHLAQDQKAIWLSPFRMTRSDLKWAVPFAATTAALIATDRHTSDWVSRNGSLPSVSHKVSWGGSIYGAGGTALGFYLIGRATGNARARETGVLAAEALANTYIVTQVIKLAAGRERPNENDGHGRFWKGGSSFPSGHSSTAWSVATVVAYEYNDRPIIKYGAYGLAALVSLSRFSGRKHFISDVFTGGFIGFGIGRYVYRKRHIDGGSDPGAAPPGTFSWTPMIMPFHDPRTASYGANLTWSF